MPRRGRLLFAACGDEISKDATTETWRTMTSAADYGRRTPRQLYAENDGTGTTRTTPPAQEINIPSLCSDHVDHGGVGSSGNVAVRSPCKPCGQSGHRSDDTHNSLCRYSDRRVQKHQWGDHLVYSFDGDERYKYRHRSQDALNDLHERFQKHRWRSDMECVHAPGSGFGRDVCGD